MCKSYYLVNEERLGKRTEGYILYTPVSKEFIGMTVKAIMEQMEAGGKAMAVRYSKTQGAVSSSTTGQCFKATCSTRKGFEQGAAR